jgi:hypothetical protein
VTRAGGCAALAELATTSANIRTEPADAADATVAWSCPAPMRVDVLLAATGKIDMRVVHAREHQGPI